MSSFKQIFVFQDHVAESPWTKVSRFMPTTQTLLQFAEGRPPQPDDKVLFYSFDRLVDFYLPTKYYFGRLNVVVVCPRFFLAPERLTVFIALDSHLHCFFFKE